MAEPRRTDLRVRLERAVLVCLYRPGFEEQDLESFAELRRLAESAGAVPAGEIVQRRKKPDPRTYLGRGKVEELGFLVQARDADLILVNDELRPAQAKALEDALDVKVIDRTELILDIFASRARTKMAKLQVELAQLEYSLPRLGRMWTHLSRIEGGIGMRGPGERQIEEDRRAARRRIGELKRKLGEIGRRRARQVASREDAFKISLVGYTNSGKSTLLSRLTGAKTLVQDRLFATLDTLTRTWTLSGGRKALVSDTVGFVSRLPHSLVASFHATLEEVRNADLLLHVVDLGARDFETQIRSVDSVLEEIGAAGKPVVLVFNKVDLLREPLDLACIKRSFPDHAVVSALKKKGLGDLDDVVSRAVDRTQVCMTFEVPHEKSRIIPLIKRRGRVVQTRYTSRHSIWKAYVAPDMGARIQKMLADGRSAGEDA
jgi:GTP-binding protein HflX